MADTTTPVSQQGAKLYHDIELKQNNKLFPIAVIDYQTQLQEVWRKKLALCLAAKISGVLIS